MDRVERINEALTQADSLVGGAAFRPEALTDQFRQATSLLDGRFQREDTRQAMHSVVGHLGSTIGFMLFDQDRHGEARRVYTSGPRVAQVASDRWPLRAIIFSEMAEDTLATADPASDPPWISWFDQAELAGETGAALTALAITHDAVRDEVVLRLTQSAIAYGATGQRSKALTLDIPPLGGSGCPRTPRSPARRPDGWCSLSPPRR